MQAKPLDWEWVLSMLFELIVAIYDTGMLFPPARSSRSLLASRRCGLRAVLGGGHVISGVRALSDLVSRFPVTRHHGPFRW